MTERGLCRMLPQFAEFLEEGRCEFSARLGGEARTSIIGSDAGSKFLEDYNLYPSP
jgi:hypothetical protein